MRSLTGVYLASTMVANLLLTPVGTAIAGTGSSGPGSVSAPSFLGSKFLGDVVGVISAPLVDFVVSFIIKNTQGVASKSETLYQTSEAVTNLAIVLYDMNSKDIERIETYLLPMIVDEGKTLDQVAKEASLYLNIKNNPIKFFQGMTTLEQQKMRIRAVAETNGVSVE